MTGIWRNEGKTAKSSNCKKKCHIREVRDCANSFCDDMQNRRRASTTRKVRRYSRPVTSANCGNGEFMYPEGLGLKGNGLLCCIILEVPLEDSVP